MKFKSQVYTQASGSIGGITYSHNRGGLYTRSRAIPTDPGTVQQQVIRGLVGGLATYYSTSLTPAQRAGWKLYAEQVPIVDALGEPINIGAVAQFLRTNVARLQSAQAQIDDAPTIFNLAETPQITPTASEATQLVSVAFDDGQDWCSEDDAFMFIFVSRPQNESINFFKGPYRLADAIAGDSAVPITSPQTVTAPFPFVEGQKLFVKANVGRADGRYSTPFRNGCVAAA